MDLDLDAKNFEKTVSQLRAAGYKSDDVETWIMRAVVICMTTAISHERGNPMPPVLLQHFLNALVAYMPTELMIAGGNMIDIFESEIDEIVDLENLFDASPSEE